MGGSVSRRRLVGVVVFLAAAALLVLLFGGGGGDEPGEAAPPPNPVASRPAEARGASPGPAADLSPSELADQLILAGFDGDDPRSDVIGEVADHRLGGVLIGPANWRGAGPGRKLIAAIRKAGSTGGAEPPLIATAQEGGTYRALKDLPPTQREIEIGDRGDPRLAERWSEDAARALADVGVDLDLAPVADVATLDSAIADRAFSDDSAVAAQMTAAAVRGCAAARIACAVSHFPGLGAASQDTAAGPATVGLDAGTLAGRDLVPFGAAFAAGAPATVVASAFYSAYDPVTPASLSTAITTDLLRGELGFEGVAISDDIGAGAIDAVTTPAQAAVAAVGAGIDLVQVADPRDVAPVRRALRAAIEDGTLSEERAREAAGRILALKRELAGSR